MKSYFILLFTVLCTWVLSTPLVAQCDNDTTPPIPICITGLQAQLDDDTGEVTIWAGDVDQGSFDECTDVHLNLTLDGTATEPPSTESVTFTAIGVYTLILWVTDEAGNFNSCWSSITITEGGTGCGDDTTPPVAVCSNLLNAGVDFSGTVTITAPMLNDGSYDDCTGNLDFRIAPAGSATSPPSETTITYTTLGNYDTEMWVIDQAGNWSSCVTSVTVEDQLAPAAVCQDVITITLSDVTGEATLLIEDVDEGSFDNYSSILDISLVIDGSGDTPASSVTFDTPGNYIVILNVQDESGNESSCWSSVNVLGAPDDCEDDTEDPNLGCINGLVASLSGVDNTIDIWATDFIAFATDNCTADLNFSLEVGDPGTSPPADQSILFDNPGTYEVAIWVIDEAGNNNFCETFIIIQENPLAVKYIYGQVFLDENANCSIDGSEEGLFGWEVELIPYINAQPDANQAQTIFTDNNGGYTFELNESLINQVDYFELRLPIAVNIGGGCDLSYTLTPDDFDGLINLNYDFAAQLQDDCYNMHVDISAPFLRRCFESYYVINYCNYGAETAEEAYVEVTLDDYITYSSSSFPFSSVDGNTYTFELGNIAPGECGFFNVFVEISCEAVLGQAHCSEAIIYPNKPCSGDYSGAIIEVTGDCDEDTEEVKFTITNVGQEAMTTARDYLVVEDVIMYMEEPFNLGSGESILVTIPGNGSTYRLEAEQPEDYPLLGLTGASVEGCGTDNDGNISLGIVTQFSVLEAGPSISIDCQENIGAYDPNDKQASPVGVGEDHLLRENTSIDYKIRFQNTGTDTAFTVVVLDTLSEWLNTVSVRPGASSHPYTFQVLEDNVLAFRFENIMLPDSNVNEPASNGFVTFSVDQLADNPHGTVIENSAAIYFDFNEPIITNTVFHTIGELTISAITEESYTEGVPLKVYPNPFKGQAVFEIPQSIGGVFVIYNMNGQRLLQHNYQGEQYILNSQLLKGSGMYFYEIQTLEGNVYRGKLIAEQ
jgi:hypothetical protein